MPYDMCTEKCSGQIISQINKWMNIFTFYLISDTEHYQLMILNELVVKQTYHQEK